MSSRIDALQVLQSLNRYPLELVTVADRNVPNKERICLKAHATVRLNDYLLILGLALGPNNFIPLQDTLLWLGNQTVDPGTWVLVYTGPGVNKVTTEINSGAPAVALHWGKQNTLFPSPAIVPVLMRPTLDTMQIGAVSQ
jgi:hypothetical protein